MADVGEPAAVAADRTPIDVDILWTGGRAWLAVGFVFNPAALDKPACGLSGDVELVGDLAA